MHNNKLNELQIQQPNFRFIYNVIFNFSLYNLSKKEKFLLSIGIDFCHPCFKPIFSQFFLPFGQLSQCIKTVRDSSSFYTFRKLCSTVVYKSFHSLLNPNLYPFLKTKDLLTLKT